MILGVADESIEKGGFPRRCGGDPPKADVTKLMKEFSPHLRGKQRALKEFVQELGITPAPAGKT